MTEKLSRFRLFGLTALTLAFALSCVTGAVAAEDDCFTGDAERAIPVCTSALADNDLLTPSKQAQFRRARAGHLLSIGAFSRALADLDAIESYDKTQEIYHRRRAEALIGLGRPDDALAAITTGLGFAPLSVPGLLIRARLLIDSGQPDAAIADAGLAATLEPENAEANQMMAEALAAVGAADAAARSAEAAKNPPEIGQSGGINIGDPSDTDTAANATSQAGELELTFWNDVKNTDSPEELRAFLAAFPDSVFVRLARLRLNRLTGQEPASIIENPPAMAKKTTPDTDLSAAPPVQMFRLKHGHGRDSTGWTMLELADGGYIIVGSIHSEGKQSEAWVARLDIGGAIRWEKSWGDTRGDSITGAALTGGHLMLIKVSETDDHDLVDLDLIGMSLDGEILWQRELGQSSAYLNYAGINPLRRGGAVITTASEAADKDDLISRVIRTDEQGRILWDRQYPKPEMNFAIDALDNGSGLYVLANIMNANSRDPNLRLLHLNYEGEVLWDQIFADQAVKIGTAIDILKGGDLVVSGAIGKHPMLDVWVARLSSDGKLIWSSTIDVGDPDNTLTVAALTSGEIAVAGGAGVSDEGQNTTGWVAWLDGNGEMLARMVLGDDQTEQFYGAIPLRGGALGLVGSVMNQGTSDAAIFATILPPLSQIPGTAFQPENSSIVRRCELLAAHNSDTQNLGLGKGSDWAAFDADAARFPCTMAHRAFPENVSTTYHLGRVQHKLEQWQSAIDLYENAASQGHIRAEVGLGVIYSEGPETFRDQARAVEMYTLAANRNDPIALTTLAGMYLSGRGVAQDLDRSAALYQTAANAGIAVAQYELGRHYQFGWGVITNLARAAEWYQKAADQEHAAALNALAYLNNYGLGMTENRRRAFQLYQRAAELGNGPAMLEMGRIYDFAKGVDRDYAKAAEWYKKAADLDIAEAKSNLGFLYEYGYGVERDTRHATLLFREAASADDAQGLYWMGRRYEYGDQVTQDLGQAANYYNKAAAKNYGSAMIQLAFMYRDGRGFAKDEVRAFELFRQAADMRFSAAQREYGWLTFLGRGTIKNVSAAIKSIEDAAGQGDTLAQIYLGYIFETERSVYDPKRAAAHYVEGLKKGEAYPATRKTSAWDRATATELQRILKQSGHYNSAIDGRVGPGTVQAMKALCKCGN
ncbi:MAG: SEL1-like repeat protein [Rhodobacteraceae bacterium]|nr:SEL1-like repeat protein [Paracoccaceae bacterium]